MAVIRPAELTRLRNTAESLLDDLVDITDPGTVTVTESGGTEISWPSTVEDVPCLVQSATIRQVQNLFGSQAAQLVINGDHIVMLPYGTVIQPGWSVTWDGNAYAVVDVAEPGTYGVLVPALLRRDRVVGG